MDLPRLALMLTVSLAAADAFSQSPGFKQSLLGDWTVEACELKGRKLRTGTKIAKLTIVDDSITMLDAGNDQQVLRYELLQGDLGWSIDLYAQYGPTKGMLIPSRVAIEDGELKLLFPANAEARNARPQSFDSAENPDWLLLRLSRVDGPDQ